MKVEKPLQSFWSSKKKSTFSINLAWTLWMLEKEFPSNRGEAVEKPFLFFIFLALLMHEMHEKVKQQQQQKSEV